MPWLKLIRWQNLLIILLTQFVGWWCIILPASPEVLTPLNFSCLALSTMLIAAAGYIINDYFDVRIDAINKPGKVLIETVIPRKQAIISHALINIIALVLAGYVAAQARHYEWLLLQLFCALLLWVYSTDLKKKYMVGNMAVALLTALTVIALFIYEPVMHRDAGLPFIHGLEIKKGGSSPVWVLGVFAYFAFMLTWMREIVKDMEDLKGDMEEGCTTMPIKRGLKYSVHFTMALSVLVIVPLIIGAYILFRYSYRLLPWYLLVLLVLPLNIWTVFLARGTNGQHYHKASAGLKLIMVLGICSLLIYNL